MAASTVKFFFLVAGFDYEHAGLSDSLDFWKMATGRVRERIAFINRTLGATDAIVTADATLRFLRFNVGTGAIEVIDKDFVAGKGIKDKAVLEPHWKPISSIGTGDQFDPATFVSTGPFRAIDRATDYINLTEKFPDLDQSVDKNDIMSIVDIYASVRGAPSNSVLELSFLSHGWIQGPVLVNSSDRNHDPNLRDPRDKDGRAALDFNLNMGVNGTPAALRNLIDFMASFDAPGIMRCWGCNFDIELRVVQQTITAMKATKGAFPDSSNINFKFEDWAPGRYSVVDPTHSFFPADSTITTMTRTFGQVKKFLLQRLTSSYVFMFNQETLGRTAFGALPGTEGDDEKTGFRMMKVCAKFDPPECPVGFAPLFDFYDKVLGIKVDDRGYGVFDKDTAQKLTTQLAALP